jgi:hypothetical protein
VPVRVPEDVAFEVLVDVAVALAVPVRVPEDVALEDVLAVPVRVSLSAEVPEAVAVFVAFSCRWEARFKTHHWVLRGARGGLGSWRAE